MKNNSKLGGFNFIIISVITVLYVLLVNKLAEIISLNNNDTNIQINTYVGVIYFVSLIGLVIAYVYLSDEKKLIKLLIGL